MGHLQGAPSESPDKSPNQPSPAPLSCSPGGKRVGGRWRALLATQTRVKDFKGLGDAEFWALGGNSIPRNEGLGHSQFVGKACPGQVGVTDTVPDPEV